MHTDKDYNKILSANIELLTIIAELKAENLSIYNDRAEIVCDNIRLREVIEEQKFTLQQSRDIIKRLHTENKKLKRLLEEVSGLKAKNKYPKYPNLTSEQREANLDYNLKILQGGE